jgi:putative OPT family oligopeptide transporter
MSSGAVRSGGATLVPGIKPPGEREFTLRAVLVGLVVAAVVAASYPYIALKLGFGPNISVVSAFFGYIALGIVTRTFRRWENNMVETAGTAAGQTAFLCALMAAFDLLRQVPGLGFTFVLEPWQCFAWLTTAGTLGVLLAVPMRQHFVVDEKLPYPDGVAAAETLILLDSRGPQAKRSALAMVGGLIASGAVMLLQKIKVTVAGVAGAVATKAPILSELLPFDLNSFSARTGVGMSTSFLSLGSGMIIGLRVTLWMIVGCTLAWVVAPPLLVENGVLPETAARKDVLLWVMWPATGMLVAGGLCALALKWNILIRTFRSLSKSGGSGGDFPIRWVAIGSAIAAVALVLVQHFMFELSVVQTLIAIVLTIPLMLVGLRVLGETNWGPISALSNLMQAVFALLYPGNLQANVVASGVTGSIAAESEGLIQDYKAGYILGTTPKYLTYMQLLAIPVGAVTVSFVYPMLRDEYGIGGDGQLTAPISQKWVGFAQLVAKGFGALPSSAFLFMIVGAVLGILLTLLEQIPGWRKWVPSSTGIGIGMLISFGAVFTMFLGGWIDFAWRKLSPESADKYLIPIASGLIAGEALIAVAIAILAAAGVWSP